MDATGFILSRLTGSEKVYYCDLIKDAVGISSDELERSIVELNNAGIIKRYVTPHLPPYAYYVLTEAGKKFASAPEEAAALIGMERTQVTAKVLGEQQTYSDVVEFNNDIRRLFKDKAILDNGNVTTFCRMFGDEMQKEVNNCTIISKWLFDDECGFMYVFGAPGPDYWDCRFIDYGRTWAFEPDDYLAKLKPTREKTPWGTEYDCYMEEEETGGTIDG